MTRTPADVKEFVAGKESVTIRRVGPEFADGLARLSAETFCRAYDSLHSADNLAAYCAAVFTPDKLDVLLRDPLIHCEVAFLGDEAVGHVMVAHHDYPLPLGGPASELKRLYILPHVFGQCVGKALFDRAVAATVARERSHLWLSVADINIRGRPFYDRLGFLPVARGPTFRVGSDSVTSTLMALAL